ncbi:class II aldolase/adducin family protein [Micromonospora sp. DT81.3]|uniref:class II aldolase/adducin family protein n=1 Tax=Micromonospora sp. DT81.3 TaxID=3416523 RepID=UPI003CE8B83A
MTAHTTPVSGDEESDTARRIVAVARHLVAQGLSPGSSGNISARVRDRLLVTPTGSALSRVEVSDLAVLDLDGRRLAGAAPSKEWPLHAAAYRADPAIGGVVHLHSAASTAIACLPAEPGGSAALPTYTPYRVMSLGDVPLLDYADPGSPALAQPLAAAVHAGAVAILLANHGSLCCGESVERAADRAEELEASARLALDLSASGAAQLDEETIARLRTRRS